MNWISNSQVEFQNGPSTLCGCIQIAITSLFQLQFAHCLKCWTLDFLSLKIINSIPKLNFRKYSKFFLKAILYATTRFWVLNFHAIESYFMPHFHIFLPSFLLHNGHFSSPKLMISSSCLFSWSMSLYLLIFSFDLFLIFQNLKWFKLHPFLPLNLW